MDKNIFIVKETTFQGVKGFELSQVQNDKVICTQFIKKDLFPDFIRESGIAPEQLKYIWFFRPFGILSDSRQKARAWFAKKKLERLYALLERAEREHDAELQQILRWAIFQLENWYFRK